MRPTAKWRASVTRHGEAGDNAKSPEYKSWATMKQRCLNPRYTHYAYYGGRGITICERWQNSFEAFLRDMGRRPSLQHTLDRYPDKDGNYEPENCRWATKSEQVSNRRKYDHGPNCKQGHPFTPENTYVDSRGDRNCRKCRARRLARYQEVALGHI